MSIEKDPGWQQILLSRAEQKRNRITVDFFVRNEKKECKEVQQKNNNNRNNSFVSLKEFVIVRRLWKMFHISLIK